MEEAPKTDVQKEENIEAQAPEATFEQNLMLAGALREAVNTRNTFVRRQGGFDTFAEVGQYGEGMRSQYDAMEDKVTRLRAEFDVQVKDKRAFVDRVRSTGNEELAGLIGSMFGVDKQSGFFTRIRKGW